ncbi:MAG: glycosyltransferase [Desulfovibrionaceae bacterium]|nr:glycosyltransferase [Desulfovibrionaceae bacterium]
MPILSIVVPNRNYGRFADRVFGSLDAQSMPLDDVEILFMDDGSDDDSIQRANGWRRRISCARFEVWPLPRTGRPGPVRNRGLSLASGRYLMSLDPDDALRPDYLARCLDALESGADLVYTDYVEHGWDEHRAIRLPDFHPAHLRMQNTLSPTAVYRRELWDAGVRYRDNTDYEDWDYWVQCLMAGARFHHLPSPLYDYHLHSANFSRQAREHDGRAKALIVRNNPAFFHRRVREWADDYLRGRPLSQAFRRGHIPSPKDLAALLRVVESARARAAGF